MRSERDIGILLGQNFLAGAIRLSANIPMPAMGSQIQTFRGAICGLWIALVTQFIKDARQRAEAARTEPWNDSPHLSRTGRKAPYPALLAKRFRILARRIRLARLASHSALVHHGRGAIARSILVELLESRFLQCDPATRYCRRLDAGETIFFRLSFAAPPPR